MQILIDTLYATAKAGGWVLIPICVVGALGFYFLLGTMNHLGRDFYRRDFQKFIHAFEAFP